MNGKWVHVKQLRPWLRLREVKSGEIIPFWSPIELAQGSRLAESSVHSNVCRPEFFGARPGMFPGVDYPYPKSPLSSFCTTLEDRQCNSCRVVVGAINRCLNGRSSKGPGLLKDYMYVVATRDPGKTTRG